MQVFLMIIMMSWKPSAVQRVVRSLGQEILIGDFLPGGYEGQIGVKLPEWELVRILGPAQDISGKKRSWEIQALMVRSESCRSFWS